MIWLRVAGDRERLHAFTRTLTNPGQWWLYARCGRGPGVGHTEHDERLPPCEECDARASSS